MNNLYELLQAQAKIIDEPLATVVRWTAGERIASVNDAAIQLNRDLKIMEEEGSLSTVANQVEYNLPRRQDNLFPIFEDMEVCIFEPGKDHRVLTPLAVKDYTRLQFQYGTPTYYIVFPREGKVRFYPTPDAAAETTAINNVSGITAAATSMTVDSTSSFPDHGRVKIDNEVIQYDAKTSTTFTQLTRAIEGTLAATHADNATVTWRNISMHFLRKPERLIRYYNTGTCATTNDDATVTGTNTVFTDNVLAGDFFGAGLKTTAEPEQYYEILSITSDTALELISNWLQVGLSTQVYGIGQPLPFPDAYNEALLYLSCHKLLYKDDDPKVSDLYAKYLNFVQMRGKDEIPADYLPVSGGGAPSGRWEGLDLPVTNYT